MINFRTLILIFLLIFVSSSCNFFDRKNTNQKIASKSQIDEMINNLEVMINKNISQVNVRDFDFYKLNDNDLYKLYSLLLNKVNLNVLYKKLSFEVKDELIRRLEKSYFDNDLNRIDFLSKIDFLKNIRNKSSYFYETICILCNSSNYLENVQISNSTLISSHSDEINVLLASFEAPNARVGGIGEYLSGILTAQSNTINNPNYKEKIKGSLITPFYDFLKSKYFDKAIFIGMVKHYLDGNIYRSSIYKISEGNITQYLIQPDPNYSFHISDVVKIQGWEIFDVGSQTKIFNIVGNDAGWLYYTTALVSFSSLFRGESGNDYFDILHINGKFVAFSNLIQKKYNVKRAEAGLPKIGILSTLHDNHAGNFFNTNIYTRIGLTKPSEKEINIVVLMNENSDYVNFVSKTTELDTLNPSFWPDGKIVSDSLKKLYDKKLYSGINNGVFFKNFDITQNSVLGKLSVKNDYSDYVEKKLSAKEFLFNKGIIGSKTKPLYLFVGRFSPEKGLDVLADFARYIVKNKNGQVVIMGAISGYIPPELMELKNLEDDISTYQGLIKVYLNYDKDQLAKIDEIGATKGKIIRFASDFTIVPSVIEASGLVPVEGLSMGSATISSYREGLKDQCTNPYGIGFNISNFTCIPFNRVLGNTLLTINNLINSINHPLDEWNSLAEADKKKHQIFLIENAKTFDWNIKGGALDQYIHIYSKIIAIANSK
ncbi:glycosyltransferase [Pigmentibacter ruber]